MFMLGPDLTISRPLIDQPGEEKCACSGALSSTFPSRPPILMIICLRASSRGQSASLTLLAIKSEEKARIAVIKLTSPLAARRLLLIDLKSLS